MIILRYSILGFIILWFSSKPAEIVIDDKHLQISGIYPHLAYYNNEGECGTGAVVPWADRLWVITYGPHKPIGSSDKLYEITPDLDLIVRDESIGGTPANRMIHWESNQLFIGPYAIDEKRNVRAISYQDMQGRDANNLQDNQVNHNPISVNPENVCQKPAIAMMVRMAGIPNGQGSEILVLRKVPTI